jgi:hypothetical protein
MPKYHLEANQQPALISLRAACAHAGICVPTAIKLAERNAFPKITPLGGKRGKRVIGRAAFLRWLEDRTGTPTAA